MATKTLEVQIKKLHPVQREIADGLARFNVVNAGRRTGKTTLSENLLTKALLKTGREYGYFAPTYKSLTEVWKRMKRILEPVTIRKDEQTKQIQTLSGGSIDFWSLDSDVSIKGRAYAGVVIDEAAHIRNGGDIWDYTIRPTLTDYEGWALFVSTPNGRNHFWKWYQRGNDPEYPDWRSWTYPTASNPYIKPEEIEAARLELPERVFEQEYLAKFLEGEGTVFRRIDNAAILTAPILPDWSHRYVMGLDWAMQNDFTVGIVLDADTRQMVDIERFNQIDWSVQRGRVKSLAEKWRVSQIVAEKNSIGSPNIEALQRDGLPVVAFETTAMSKPPLIESLVLAFERDEITIWNEEYPDANARVLINELEAYERKVSSTTGRSQYNAPSGLHDDCVMAIALAWHGLNQPVRKAVKT